LRPKKIPRYPNPSRLPDRHDLGYRAKEAPMKRQIVIYKAKPEHNAENERLLKGVFAEL
jgi:hypothetical protein